MPLIPLSPGRALLALALLLAAASASAQDVAGRFGVRSQWDLAGPLRLRAEQQLQVTLVTPGDGGTFGGIDVVFDDDQDDDDGPEDGPDEDDGPDGPTPPGTPPPDDDRAGGAAGKAAAEPATPTTFLTDWASRTELGLDVRLTRALRAAAELGLVLRDGGPVGLASVGLQTQHGLTDALDVGTSAGLEVQREDAETEARARVGVGVERARGALRPSLGVELFADPAAGRLRRARVDVGAALRLAGGQRVGAELRLQRRVDRADAWDTGARLTYRLDL